MPTYEIDHLTKIYRKAAVPASDDLSLTVAEGQLLGVFGPNGAGKTTLVRQMTALLKPTSGSIRLFGTDIVRHPEIVPTQVGYYGQQVVALRNHKFREVLEMTGILRGMPTPAAKKQSDSLLEEFDAGKLAERRLAIISGGERRLAVLLATFMAALPVLIFDEPTNELDPVRRRTFWTRLGRLNRESGTTVILATHNLMEAEQVVDRVVVIDRGTLVASGTPGELKRQVDNQVRLEIRLKGGHVECEEEKLAGLVGSRRLKPGWWEITALQDQAATLLPRVVEMVGFDKLDDFRLITPTMEDVYVHLTGRSWEKHSGSKRG